MPTGYTCDVQDGTCTQFNDFVWKCARAFGALISQREDSLNDGIQLKDVPSSYHEEQLVEAKKEYLRLRKMRQSERLRFSRLQFEATLRRNVEGARKHQEQHMRYSTMLGKVAMWEPPTEDHAGLKEFMVSQLTESIDFDCNHDYNLTRIQEAVDSDLLVFHTNALNYAKRDICYHERKLAEEHERIGGRNQWRQQLVDSVGLPPKVKGERNRR
jgi:hypothetical protein